MAKEKAAKLGLPFKHFTTHDIKRKAISDYKGNKKDFGGHRTDMLRIYDASVKPMKPTSES